MPRRPPNYSKKNGPKVIALDHGVDFAPRSDWFFKHYLPELKRGGAEVRRIFQEAAKDGRPRRLFIEGTPFTAEHYLALREEELETNPFAIAMKEARKLGWTIIPLSSEPKRELLENIEPVDFLARRFYIFNLREDEWVRRLSETPPADHDFVVIHPVHVKGLLTQTGMRAKRVRWIHKNDEEHTIKLGSVKEQEQAKFFRRLNSTELRRLWRRFSSGQLDYDSKAVGLLRYCAKWERESRPLFEKYLKEWQEQKPYKK